MPKASDSNQVISIDLKFFNKIKNKNNNSVSISDNPKDLISERIYVLYLVDEFTKFTRGQVIKDKTPRSVIEGIEENWIRRGPGWPTIGFFSDQGTEFCNEMLREYVKKVGCSHRSTPAFSPWSNGTNERNHGAVDKTVMKLLEEHPDMSLQEAVDESCFWKNNEVMKTGFSSHQLMWGKGTAIPGVAGGSLAIDSPVQNDEVSAILARHHQTRMLHAQADTDRRVKAMLSERRKEYKDYQFQPGERVMVKDKDKPIWDETKVHSQEGNNVNIFKDGRINSVPLMRVKPAGPVEQEEERKEENEKKEEEEEEIEEKEEERKEEKRGKEKIRPKKGDKIKFNLIDEEGSFEGQVTKVGKSSGKDKHRCWIRFEDEETKSYDFSYEVEKWNKVNMVHFTEEVKETETRKEIRQKEIEMEQEGTKILYYAMREDILEDEKKVNDVLVTEIPKKLHGSPEVIEAKELEMSNFIKFGAYQEVEDEGQPRITSRWVVTEKEAHDGQKKRIKARLVVRGF